ncbi:solute carrier family 15 member 2-like [Trichosurus vulpecula]|uniref:solute carrier family 15 member 2-like n=1 Tax=Trichosurus vulpecula TaxID=9337 RepID=UPI00186B2D96|nr:solute carrier family 15 member 2-like [Trichosurus vulpecula]
MEVSDVEKCEEDQLLKIKKFRNKYPVSVIILLVLQWLDSISFSGMHGMLILYFVSQFSYFSTHEIYLHQMFRGHVVILAFVAATITDSWLGKFNAFIGSNILLLLAHFTVIIKEKLSEDILTFRFLVILGLFSVALATSIKMPSLLCLAGDQFPAHQVKKRNKVFSSLYLSIVFGAFFADVAIPFVLEETCSSSDCFLIFFGTSAGIVTFNLVIFIFSKKLFFIEIPQGSKLLKILKCVQCALKNQLRHCSMNTPRRDHWLDWASEKFSENHINEVKILFRLLLLLSPLPIFWALVEKQQTEWIEQAKKMTTTMAGHALGNEDLQLFFPAILLISLILMELAFIPLAEWLGINFSLIKKVMIGMIFIYLSSLMSFLLELQIERSPSIMPGSRESFLRILNVADVSFRVNFLKNGSYVSYSKMSQIFEDSHEYHRIYLDSKQQYFQINLHSYTLVKKEEILLQEKTKYIMILSGHKQFYSVILVKEITTKPDIGTAHVRIINTLDKDAFIVMSVTSYLLPKHNGISSELTVRTKRNINLICMIEKKKYVLELGLLQFGASYMIFVIEATPVLKTWKTKWIEMKALYIGWQLPQILIMGIGRYLLIVSCMEFFYYKAAKGTKVTVQALWTSTLSSGSLILYLVNYTSFLPQWIEYFLLSNILLLMIISFFIIGYYYHETILNS